MEKDYLVLKRASASRSSGEWNEDDYDTRRAVLGSVSVMRTTKTRFLRREVVAGRCRKKAIGIWARERQWQVEKVTRAEMIL